MLCPQLASAKYIDTWMKFITIIMIIMIMIMIMIMITIKIMIMIIIIIMIIVIIIIIIIIIISSSSSSIVIIFTCFLVECSLFKLHQWKALPWTLLTKRVLHSL